ncbi:MAG: glycerophosphodiester phosphodiesterase family protein [Balneolales bacterium]
MNVTYLLSAMIALSVFACSKTESVSSDVEVIGHRGITGLMPENTIPGFIKALDHGVNGVEFDVVISGDKEVVISHEPWFRHDICLTPSGEVITQDAERDNNLYEMTYEQIAEFDCGSIQRANYPDQENMPMAKPLMSEAILAMEEHVVATNSAPINYYVEIKSNPAWDNQRQPEPSEVARLVYDELKELEVLDQSLIMAFDVRMLQAMNEIDDEVTMVFLVSGNKPDMAANLDELQILPDVYAPNHSLIDAELIQNAREQGMRVTPWTVNDSKDMTRLIELGVNGIITDYANRFPVASN